MRLGLLSTAHITGAILSARAEDTPFEIVAVSAEAGAPITL